jgi:CYTH domain-containing protein
MSNLRTEFKRLFLLEGLPANLKASDEHLQIFDNYIENTRLRLRSFRNPKTKDWTFILQQIQSNQDFSEFKIAEISLNEEEHHAFEIFEGREIKKNERIQSNELRFNRYFYKNLEIDVYLGKEIWGLVIANARFENAKTMQMFQKPNFAVIEVTGDSFFYGENLIGKTFADVRERIKNK